jgi:CBS domain-containing protein
MTDICPTCTAHAFRTVQSRRLRLDSRFAVPRDFSDGRENFPSRAGRAVNRSAISAAPPIGTRVAQSVVSRADACHRGRDRSHRAAKEAEMRVSDVMSTNLRTVDARDTIEHASAMMHDAGVHHLVVLSGGRLVGLVSADRLEQGETEGILRVEEVMRRHVRSVPPDTPLTRAAGLLRNERVGALPIVSEDRVVGIVTVSDLLDVIAHGSELATGASHRRLSGRKRTAGAVVAADRAH